MALSIITFLLSTKIMQESSSARQCRFRRSEGRLDYILFDSDDYIEDGFFNCLDTYNEDLIILNSRNLSPTGDMSDSLFSKTSKATCTKKSGITHFISNNI